MFKVVLNDGQNEMPKDDIYYIIGKEGVFLKKKLGVMESIAPVKNISILESVASSARMHITKIPGKYIAKVISFFREVYDTYNRSEAIVLLFYNEQTGEHKIVPPHQKVAGASCDYDKGLTIDGYTMIGTIHSHGNMSAFHSGVDDSDEEHFDGLHLTFGDLGDKYPSLSSSIVSNGFRQMIEPEKYIDNIVCMSETNSIDNKSVKTVYKWKNGKLIEDVDVKPKYPFERKKFDRRYDIVCSDEDRIFNKNWMSMVEKGVYTFPSYRNGYAGWYGYAAHAYNDGWGFNYDRSIWKQNGKNINSRASKPGIKPVIPTPLKFPPHTQDGDFVPCATCTHRLCKLTSEIEEDDFEEMYFCKNCGEIVKEEEGFELQCSTCNTNEHLILLDKEEVLSDQYIPGDEYDHMFKKDSTKEIEESSYIKCKECGNGFHLNNSDETCPFCYTPINSIEKPEQPYTNKGVLLTREVDEITQAAKKEDEPIQRIPEPGSTIIPISEQPNGLMAMFKKVFKREVL